MRGTATCRPRCHAGHCHRQPNLSQLQTQCLLILDVMRGIATGIQILPQATSSDLQRLMHLHMSLKRPTSPATLSPSPVEAPPGPLYLFVKFDGLVPTYIDDQSASARESTLPPWGNVASTSRQCFGHSWRHRTKCQKEPWATMTTRQNIMHACFNAFLPSPGLGGLTTLQHA